MLDRNLSVPLWRQLAELLEGEIAAGTYGPGDRLPSESVLAGLYRVNRHTVRRTMSELSGKGAVRVEKGRGSFVREPVIHYPVKRRTRFSENLTSQRRAPANTLLQAVDVPAPAKAARALDVRPGEMLTRITSAGEADGRRICCATSYFSRTRFPAMIQAYRETGSVTRSLKRFGLKDYSRKSTRIIARMPTTAEAEALCQPRTRPVLVTESVNVDDSGAPVEYGICTFASDWVQIVVEPS